MPQPGDLRALIQQLTAGDRSAALCLLALVQQADDDGVASFGDIVRAYREDYLAALEAEGRDVQHEAGRLSVDEVMAHLGGAVLPRLAATGAIVGITGTVFAPQPIRMTGAFLQAFREDREALRVALRA